MKIFVRVKTNTKKDYVERKDKNHFVVWVKAEPKEGKANKAVLHNLSKFFSIPKSYISFRSGLSSREKVFDILIDEDEV